MVPRQILVQSLQHPCRRDVDERDGFGVDDNSFDARPLRMFHHELADRIDVGEEKAGLRPENYDPVVLRLSR
jgi:hypothetical protein